MSDLKSMYAGIAFSPPTILVQGVNSADTVLHVQDTSVFPPGPNRATIGTDANAETILYAQAGDGILSGCTRGVEGTAKRWESGEIVARNFTNADYKDLTDNIAAAKGDLEVHTDDKENPHGTSAAQIGAATGDADGNAQNSLKLGGLPPAAFIQAQPNLLDNPNFAINQRGANSYEVNGNIIYTFDRWELASKASAEIQKHGGIKLTFSNAPDAWGGFLQKYEKAELLRNKEITFSVMCRASISNNSNFYIYSRATQNYIKAVSVIPDNQWHVITCTGIIPDIAHSDGQIEFTVNGSYGTLEIAWAKVEMGERFTGWSPPNPVTELAKCQRYYWKSTIEFVSMNVLAIPYLFANVQFPVKMRINPTVTIYSRLGTKHYLSDWGSGRDTVPCEVNLATLSNEGFNGITARENLEVNGAYSFRVIADADYY